MSPASCRVYRGVALLLALCSGGAEAADAAAGRLLYSALPGNPGPGSCVSCHGDPADNRNNLLLGAGRPGHIVRTMNTVSAMGFLRAHLSDENVADIAAYLATVLSGVDLSALPSPMPTTDFFGAQLVASASVPRRIEIRGAANAPVALGGIVSSRPDVFPAVSDCPASLLPGGRCNVTVRFVPGAAGDASGLVSIVAADGTTLRSTTVSGEGTDTAPPVLAWAEGAPSIDFGDVVVGGSIARRVTLVNTGLAPVRLTQLRASGPAAARFRLTGTCMTGTVLAGGANCAIDVGFAPATTGGVEAWIEVVASATSPPLVRLAAQAVAVSASAPPVVADGGGAQGEDSGGGAMEPWALLLLALGAVLLARRPVSSPLHASVDGVSCGAATMPARDPTRIPGPADVLGDVSRRDS